MGSPPDARDARSCRPPRARGLLALLAAGAALLASAGAVPASGPVVTIRPGDDPAAPRVAPRRPALWLSRAPAGPRAQTAEDGPAVRPTLSLEPDEDAPAFALPAPSPMIAQVAFLEEDGPALDPEVVFRPPALLPVPDETVPVFALQQGGVGGIEEAEKSRTAESLLRLELQPPGPQRLFRLESEAALQERIRQEAHGRTPRPLDFPQEPVLADNHPPIDRGPQRRVAAEANYVCYHDLVFDQRYGERYGWDLGAVQPLLSAGHFYFDLLTYPYHLVTDPCPECSAGYCLPGDPVPLLIEPPQYPWPLGGWARPAGDGLPEAGAFGDSAPGATPP
jgi:hypothetical protein